MQLDNIKEKCCHICGADTVAERQDKKHTNGYFNEYRTFECGASLHFSPNFMETRQDKPCPNSPNELNKKKKRKDAIKKYVTKLQIDSYFKKEIIESFPTYLL